MKSFFTNRQWQWIKDRHDEGYSMEKLAEFLGINRRSIRVAFVRLRLYPEMRKDLPPLAERRKEFLDLRTEAPAPASSVELNPVEWPVPQVGSAGRAPRSPD